MRLRGIVEYEAANRYLDEEYLAEHNERFACEPAAAADFHQALAAPSCEGCSVASTNGW